MSTYDLTVATYGEHDLLVKPRSKKGSEWAEEHLSKLATWEIYGYVITPKDLDTLRELLSSEDCPTWGVRLQ